MNIRKIISEEIRRVFQEDDEDEDEYYDDDYDYEFDVEDGSFNRKLPEEIKRISNRYIGRGVTWYGDPEQMIVIHKDDVHGTDGNQYDMDKLQFIEDMILNSTENVEFECSYGIANKVGFQEILEHQQAVHNERFDLDYDGYNEPYTIGNDALDQYLGNEYFFQDELNEAAANYLDSIKTKVALEIISPQQAVDGFNQEEEDQEGLKYFLELEQSLISAIKNQDGDLGKISVQIRDGHHRVMGSIAAGEQYVCLNLVKEDLAKYGNEVTRVLTKD